MWCGQNRDKLSMCGYLSEWTIFFISSNNLNRLPRIKNAIIYPVFLMHSILHQIAVNLQSNLYSLFIRVKMHFILAIVHFKFTSFSWLPFFSFRPLIFIISFDRKYFFIWTKIFLMKKCVFIWKQNKNSSLNLSNFFS